MRREELLGVGIRQRRKLKETFWCAVASKELGKMGRAEGQDGLQCLSSKLITRQQQKENGGCFRLRFVPDLCAPIWVSKPVRAVVPFSDGHGCSARCTYRWGAWEGSEEGEEQVCFKRRRWKSQDGAPRRSAEGQAEGWRKREKLCLRLLEQDNANECKPISTATFIRLQRPCHNCSIISKLQRHFFFLLPQKLAPCISTSWGLAFQILSGLLGGWVTNIQNHTSSVNL